MGLGGLLDLDGTLESKGGEAEPRATPNYPEPCSSLAVRRRVPLTVDFNTKYNLRKNAGVLNPSALKIGSAIARLNGTYNSAGEPPS